MPNKEEIKQKYLLSSSIDPLGRYVNSKKLSEKVYDSYEDYYYDCLSDVEFDPGDVLSEKDYQEIYRTIIDDIKQQIEEWKIESEGTLTVIKHDSGKKHYKEGLEEEEWKEIEQVLKQQAEIQKEKQSQESNKNMVNAQQWLDTNYPKEERNNITELNISSKFLEGKLVIKDFANLEELDCSRNQLTNLELNNLPKLKTFTGHTCQLTSLTISSCPEIAFFTVAENLLESFDFNSLNPEKLTSTLSIRDNNFPMQDLGCFSKFIKLKQLYVGNLNEKKIRKGIYNRFYGSLEPLKELKKLKEINIGSTDINEGLEYLSSDLEWVFCGNYREDAGCLKIREKLKDFLKNEEHGGTYDYQGWRKAKVRWKEKEFSDLEIDRWTEAGLKLEEVEYAVYLKRKGYDFVNDDKENLIKIHNQAQNYLDFNYPIENRKKIIKLDISSKDLEGVLNLEDFVNLEELDCSGNKFVDVTFLETVPSKEKLKKLKLANKEKVRVNVDFIVLFTKLIKLNITNCSLVSIELFKDMKELQVIYIDGGYVDSVLEYLPESLRKIYCNEPELVREISNKYLKEDSIGRYYDLIKWREDKQDSIAKVIPLERLFVIRGNIKQFLKKWSLKNDAKNLNEIGRLQSPKEIGESWWTSRWSIYATQFIGRGAAVAGAVLLFQDSQAIGGGIATIYPLAELLTSNMEKSREDRKNKWKEFLSDTDTFSDNYNELLGILTQFETDKSKKGKVNEALKDLDKKSKEFLEIYDKNGDKELDVSELIDKRGELAKDLSESKEKGEVGKLWEIINSIKKLEEAIIEYRKLSYYGASSKKTGNDNEEKSSKKSEEINVLENDIKPVHQTIDLDENLEDEKELISQQQIVTQKQ